MNNVDNIRVEDATIMFRNFEGKEEKFNPPGRRTFVVLFQPAVGEELAKVGWNIKWLKPTDEYEEETPYLQVRVNYDISYAKLKPRIVMISSQGQTMLNNETVHMLDWVDMEMVDLIIRPYHYDVQGKTGISAYVQSMYVTIKEDEFAKKYSDVPDADQTPVEYSEDENDAEVR